MKQINLGIIGVGGYAATHLDILKPFEEKGQIKIAACVIRDPSKYEEIEKTLADKGVRIYRTYQEMHKNEKGKLDLVVVPGGIDQHEEQSIDALKNGFNVLCEKPVSGTVEEALNMKKAEVEYKKFLAIGYQHIFTPAIQKIKQITLEKKLGALKKAKCLILWPRTSVYYARNKWAGQLMCNGKFVYDSPAQNATAHFLNNMLYIAGDTMQDSGMPVKVLGENYKAKDIVCADTQFISIECSNKVNILFYSAHATSVTVDPIIEFFYEKGKIVWDYKKGQGLTKVYELLSDNSYELIEEFDNGSTPFKENIYLNMIDAINNNGTPLCNISNSIQHTICIEKSFLSSNGTVNVPEKFVGKVFVTAKNGIVSDTEYNIIIKDLDKIMKEMYQKEIGFFESGVEWAKKSNIVQIL